MVKTVPIGTHMAAVDQIEIQLDQMVTLLEQLKTLLDQGSLFFVISGETSPEKTPILS